MRAPRVLAAEARLLRALDYNLHWIYETVAWQLEARRKAVAAAAREAADAAVAAGRAWRHVDGTVYYCNYC